MAAPLIRVKDGGGGRSIIHTGACNRGVPARLHITHVFILSPVMDPIKNVSNVGAFMNIRSMPYCTVYSTVCCTMYSVLVGIR